MLFLHMYELLFKSKNLKSETYQDVCNKLIKLYFDKSFLMCQANSVTLYCIKNKSIRTQQNKLQIRSSQSRKDSPDEIHGAAAWRGNTTISQVRATMLIVESSGSAAAGHRVPPRRGKQYFSPS